MTGRRSQSTPDDDGDRRRSRPTTWRTRATTQPVGAARFPLGEPTASTTEMPSGRRRISLNLPHLRGRLERHLPCGQGRHRPRPLGSPLGTTHASLHTLRESNALRVVRPSTRLVDRLALPTVLEAAEVPPPPPSARAAGQTRLARGAGVLLARLHPPPCPAGGGGERGGSAICALGRNRPLGWRRFYPYGTKHAASTLVMPSCVWDGGGRSWQSRAR